MTETTTVRTAPRLKTKYRDDIKSALQEQFSYGNVMQVPVSYTHLTLPTSDLV